MVDTAMTIDRLNTLRQKIKAKSNSWALRREMLSLRFFACCYDHPRTMEQYKEFSNRLEREANDNILRNEDKCKAVVNVNELLQGDHDNGFVVLCADVLFVSGASIMTTELALGNRFDTMPSKVSQCSAGQNLLAYALVMLIIQALLRHVFGNMCNMAGEVRLQQEIGKLDSVPPQPSPSLGGLTQQGSGCAS